MLPHPRRISCHCLDPGKNNALHDLQIDVRVDPEASLKDVRGHDIPLTRDDPKDHDRGRKLGLHDPWDVLGARSNPTVVLPVMDLVLTEILLVREESQHARVLGMLEIVQEVHRLQQPPGLHGF